MRIVTGRALQLTIVVKADLMVQGARVFQLAISACECGVIGKRDWMIVREISSEVVRAGRHGGDTVSHWDCCCPGIHHAEGHGTIMTTEAKFRGASRLPDGCLRCRTAIGRVGRHRHRVIPQRLVPRAAVRGMAE